MDSATIRSSFLKFFEERGHLVLPGHSLVPEDDPTLLWINAGMAPLKKYFTGKQRPVNPRMVSAQPSLRTNDIENVGKTARHLTLFEMLGNFSVGDYFKEEAIPWAWEYLTQILRLPQERLWVTVYPEDQEAETIWQKVGVPKARIIPLEDNFWDIGGGPCGPDSEVYFDRGPEVGCGRPSCRPGCDCDRFLEIWNLVFTQFNHNPDGSFTPLPRKNIDTGMGLERIASVLQETETNFETDLLFPLIQQACQLSGRSYHEGPKTEVALRVIADHTRAIVFAIGDGVLPSNEGRGYVIRRLLRRAVRFGKQLGIEEPFLGKLVPTVGAIMGKEYPRIVEGASVIRRAIEQEETRFLETLEAGESRLAVLIETAKREGRAEISGEEAFELYDTYGFPLDLTDDAAAEYGLKVDHDGFETAMKIQREKSRKDAAERKGMRLANSAWADFQEACAFVGYEMDACEATILRIVEEGKEVAEAEEGSQVEIALAQTPFYPEGGGQVGDHGRIESNSGWVEVQDCRRAPNGQPIHMGIVRKGKIQQGDQVQAMVDPAWRKDVKKNHTVTHLFHKALREVLGPHVHQAGSLVEPTRMRFDFTHFAPLTSEEIKRAEAIVNEQIWLDSAVTTTYMPLEQAKALGAEALFEERYGEQVRVVSVGTFSRELCGGTHVSHAGEIQLAVVTSETGIAAGVRRIEVLTGRWALQWLNQRREVLEKSAQLLGTDTLDVPAKVAQLQEELERQKQQIAQIEAKQQQQLSISLAQQVEQVAGIPTVLARVDAADEETLRSLADAVRQRLGSCAVLLASTHAKGRVSLVAALTPDWVDRGLDARAWLRATAAVLGGKGGGRKELAQGGGKDAKKLEEALATARQWLEASAVSSR